MPASQGLPAYPNASSPPLGDRAFERPTALAARMCGATGAFLALGDAGQLRLRSLSRRGGVWPENGTTLCPDGEIDRLIATFVKVADAAKEAWPNGHPAVASFGAASFISAPVLWGSGSAAHAIGCLCVFDARP